MTDYRRARVNGGTYFFTVNCAERWGNYRLVDHVETLRTVFRRVRSRHPFDMPAIVVLPDHLHCLWTLPPGDRDFMTRWMLIKASFSHAIDGRERRSASRRKRGERGIWQRRYWEHLIRDEGDFERHVEYIHWNPVKHGWVGRVADWPYSSFHRYVRRGLYPIDWGGAPDIEIEGGE